MSLSLLGGMGPQVWISCAVPARQSSPTSILSLPSPPCIESVGKVQSEFHAGEEHEGGWVVAVEVVQIGGQEVETAECADAEFEAFIRCEVVNVADTEFADVENLTFLRSGVEA